jgi:hypothetical protein
MAEDGAPRRRECCQFVCAADGRHHGRAFRAPFRGNRDRWHAGRLPAEVVERLIHACGTSTGLDYLRRTIDGLRCTGSGPSKPDIPRSSREDGRTGHAPSL